jgi:hypothetical protein
VPDVADDVNYIPHDDVAVANAAERIISTIAFEEQQRGVQPTAVKATEDPDMMEMPRDERRRAYDNDARAMRLR